jgi:hypothetical protein
VTDVAWSGSARLCYFAAGAPPLRRLGSMPLAALRHLDSSRYQYVSSYFGNWRFGDRQPYGAPVICDPSAALPSNGILLWQQLPDEESANTREYWGSPSSVLRGCTHLECSVAAHSHTCPGLLPPAPTLAGVFVLHFLRPLTVAAGLDEEAEGSGETLEQRLQRYNLLHASVSDLEPPCAYFRPIDPIGAAMARCGRSDAQIAAILALLPGGFDVSAQGRRVTVSATRLQWVLRAAGGGDPAFPTLLHAVAPAAVTFELGQDWVRVLDLVAVLRALDSVTAARRLADAAGPYEGFGDLNGEGVLDTHPTRSVLRLAESGFTAAPPDLPDATPVGAAYRAALEPVPVALQERLEAVSVPGRAGRLALLAVVAAVTGLAGGRLILEVEHAVDGISLWFRTPSTAGHDEGGLTTAAHDAALLARCSTVHPRLLAQLRDGSGACLQVSLPARPRLLSRSSAWAVTGPNTWPGQLVPAGAHQGRVYEVRGMHSQLFQVRGGVPNKLLIAFTCLPRAAPAAGGSRVRVRVRVRV